MKFFVAFFFLAACALAIQAAPAAEEPAPVAPEQQAQPVEDKVRNKRFPFAYPAYSYGLGYSAIHAPVAYHAPLAYHAPIATAYHAPLAYSAYHYPSYSSVYHL